MVKTVFLLIFSLLILVVGSKSLQARFGDVGADDVKGPIVVELFTSQSCSSCPPADRNLTSLAENQDIITLGFHVTYWDHLHWKDTLSRPFSTDRQRDYSRFQKNNNVYTPQMMVNGVRGFVGSRNDKIAKALANATPVASISLSIIDQDHMSADFEMMADGHYTIWLAGVKRHHVQDIGSGENRGRSVEYSNAVLSLEELVSWDGRAKAITINHAQNAGDMIDRYVILAQERGHGAIVAAGQVDIR